MKTKQQVEQEYKKIAKFYKEKGYMHHLEKGYSLGWVLDKSPNEMYKDFGVQ